MRLTNIRPGRIVVYALLIIFALIFLMPVYVISVSSLKSFSELQDLSRLWSLPKEPTLQNYEMAWEGIREKSLRGLSQNLLNSFKLTIPATILSSLVGSLNGYVLTKWRFRGSNIIFPFLLFGMFIPYQSVLIPMTRTVSSLGLSGRIGGLVLVHVIYGIPITTLIFRNYYMEVPDEMIEAARIDGAGLFGIYWRVLFPLSVPGFVVVIIWQFTSIWNEFLFALVLLQRPERQPITVALRNLSGSQIQEWNLVMAGTLITALPVVLIYIVLGRYFIRGLLAGSVKG